MSRSTPDIVGTPDASLGRDWPADNGPEMGGPNSGSCCGTPVAEKFERQPSQD